MFQACKATFTLRPQMGKNNKKESKAEAKEAESQTEASVPPLNEILYCDGQLLRNTNGPTC